MDRVASILTVGLTGGIASGKSTVAARLERQGAYVVDGDRLTHEALEPDGAAYPRVRARFGACILDERGAIDRSRLGRIVFADPEARADLERLVHPHVVAEWERRLDGLRAEGGKRLAVFDAALLVETGGHRRFERLVVVACSRETQLSRLMERNGLSRSEAEARLAAQAPLEQKLALADHVIDNDGPLAETHRQTDELYRTLIETLR